METAKTVVHKSLLTEVGQELFAVETLLQEGMGVIEYAACAAMLSKAQGMVAYLGRDMLEDVDEDGESLPF